jgi:hypothetical protein
MPLTSSFATTRCELKVFLSFLKGSVQHLLFTLRWVYDPLNVTVFHRLSTSTKELPNTLCRKVHAQHWVNVFQI